MKVFGYQNCYNAIIDCLLEKPHRYEAFTEYFDIEKLDKVREKYGVDLYRECYNTVQEVYMKFFYRFSDANGHTVDFGRGRAKCADEVVRRINAQLRESCAAYDIYITMPQTRRFEVYEDLDGYNHGAEILAQFDYPQSESYADFCIRYDSIYPQSENKPQSAAM